MKNGPEPASAAMYAIAIGIPSEGEGPPLVTAPTCADSAGADPATTGYPCLGTRRD